MGLNFDIIILGGGINGVAIARDAALRGLTVALIEKNKIGAGASSNTSKLAHGGLRYLEHFQFRLVAESLRERDLLMRNAPAYVKPLSFIIPAYQHNGRPLWKIKLGLTLYDFLARGSDLPKHRSMSQDEILQTIPGLRSDGLKGGCQYWDVQMQDEAIVEANLNDAQRKGARVFNGVALKSFIKEAGKITGVVIEEPNTQENVTLKAEHVVNVTGAWSNEVVALDDPQAEKVVMPVKGAHIVVDRLPLAHALTLIAPQDGRVFFAMPWQDETLIGTTESRYNGDLDHVHADQAEKDYLLQAINSYFPQADLTHCDIIHSFAGIRPLAVSTTVKTNAASRDFSVITSDSGLVTMVGGKYTTYRHMAEVLLNQLTDKGHLCRTKTTPLGKR